MKLYKIEIANLAKHDYYVVANDLTEAWEKLKNYLQENRINVKTCDENLDNITFIADESSPTWQKVFIS